MFEAGVILLYQVVSFRDKGSGFLSVGLGPWCNFMPTYPQVETGDN